MNHRSAAACRAGLARGVEVDGEPCWQSNQRGAPTVARFAIAGSVRPPLTAVLPFADKVRRALMSHSDATPVFSGRDESGRLLIGHRHAFVLPEANGRDGNITHVTLCASMGFDPPAQAALERLSWVWGRDQGPVQIVLLGVGDRDDFAGTRSRAGACPLLVAAGIWESRTPFVSTRHAKTFRSGRPKIDPESGLQLGSPAHDLRRLLLEQGFPLPERIEPIAHTLLGAKPVRWQAFRTLRRAGCGRRAARAGVGFRITFGKPVGGPVAMGYGAHFGLGVFVPGLDS